MVYGSQTCGLYHGKQTTMLLGLINKNINFPVSIVNLSVYYILINSNMFSKIFPALFTCWYNIIV